MRTTAAKVKEILDTELEDQVVEAFILGASYTIDRVFADNTELSDAHLAEIERWLAAHYIAATREQQISEAGAGGATVKYQGNTDVGLNATMYGQQAMILDTSGKLKDAMMTRRASITAV